MVLPIAIGRPILNRMSLDREPNRDCRFPAEAGVEGLYWARVMQDAR